MVTIVTNLLYFQLFVTDTISHISNDLMIEMSYTPTLLNIKTYSYTLYIYLFIIINEWYVICRLCVVGMFVRSKQNL